jgi:hypothetical protein
VYEYNCIGVTTETEKIENNLTKKLTDARSKKKPLHFKTMHNSNHQAI